MNRTAYITCWGNKYKVVVKGFDKSWIVGSFEYKDNPKSKKWAYGGPEGYFPINRITYLRYI